MRLRLTNPRDLVAAALVLGVGLYFVIHGFSYPMGTARRMGAGFFPVVLGFIACGLSLPLALRAFTVEAQGERPAVRAFLAVCGGILVFALAMPTLGLAPAAALTAVAAAAGDRGARPVETAILAVALAAATWGIFILGLGLPIPALRSPF
jgi:hypothetical protein